MLLSRLRSGVSFLTKTFGPRTVAVCYLGSATLFSALATWTLSNPTSNDSKILSAADFGKISSTASSYLTPTFDDDFWNGGDMSSDRHWRRSSRRSRYVRKTPVNINIEIPKLQSVPSSGGNIAGSGAFEGYADGSFRRVCVRMCDGYYWPVSFNGERSLSKDQDVCRNSCAAPTRLFIDNNPGTDIDQMVDQGGRPYSQLKNAYRYRNEYVADCRCKANPWEIASINRHRYYALLKSAKKNRLIAKVVRKQKRKIAIAKRKIKKQRRKEWRRIARVESFWAKRGDTRYGLGAKEVPYTDDDGYPIQVLGTRPVRRTKSSNKYVRRQEQGSVNIYLRTGNPFSYDGGNFADPSVVLGKSQTKQQKRRQAKRIQQYRMRLSPAKQKRRLRARRSSRPTWANQVFDGN